VSATGDLVEALAQVGAARDHAIDLADTALMLAALDHPGLDLAPYRAHLATLAAETGAAAAGGAAEALAPRIRALADTFAAQGYEGDIDTYDDPQNADLISVIDRRRGLPVALAVLWLHAARAQGWMAAGLAFPGHFLIRLESERERAILDPFHGGELREAGELRDLLKQVAGMDAELRPEHYAAVGNRDILLRLLNNVKLRSLQAGDATRALEIVDRLRLIAPNHVELLREAALCHMRLDNLKRAAEMLERYLAEADDGPARDEAATLLQHLRARLN
jgi:regulator of sirC expression with transglutaminase-like and TPR domain